MSQCFQLLSLVGSESRDRFVQRMGRQQRAGMWYGLPRGIIIIIIEQGGTFDHPCISCTPIKVLQVIITSPLLHEIHGRMHPN